MKTHKHNLLHILASIMRRRQFEFSKMRSTLGVTGRMNSPSRQCLRQSENAQAQSSLAWSATLSGLSQGLWTPTKPTPRIRGSPTWRQIKDSVRAHWRTGNISIANGAAKQRATLKPAISEFIVTQIMKNSNGEYGLWICAWTGQRGSYFLEHMIRSERDMCCSIITQ